MKLEFDSKFFMSIFLLGFVGLLFRLYGALVAKPDRLRSKLRKQGISGPPPTFLIGNIKDIKKARAAAAKSSSSEIPDSHNCAAAIFPFFEKWREQYGQVFTFALGHRQILYVNRPDMMREITTCTSMDLGKPAYQQRELRPLLGQGVLTSNGPIWAHQRKLLAPELYLGKVKGMMSIFTECSMSVVNSWSSRIAEEGGVADINIDEKMRTFSADVISRACFGSNYSKGEKIFQKLKALKDFTSRQIMSSGIPGMRHIPTKTNRELWALEKEVNDLILQAAKERRETSYERDLLQLLLESAKNSDLPQEDTDSFIVNNCKNIYLAGFETTSVAATWIFVLLAKNQDWLERVRAEVLEISGGKIPDYDMLCKMKQLTMVIHESMRLYPPVAAMSREVYKDMKFGNIEVPKGVIIWTMIVSSHTSPDIWGSDAYKFKPERFANGITGACKLPHLYMPFGVGPRVCLGQNLAMIELKMLVSLVVSKFSFSLSPNYIHSPVLTTIIEPQHGVHLLLKHL